MSTAKTFTIIFVVLLIGPVMFLASRYLSLGQRFDKVNIGDDVATVRSTMGAPDEEATTALRLHGDTEYRYVVKPVPGVWVVSFKAGKVVEKQKLD